MLTLVGHKFGAPKGVAALFVREGLALPPMIHGGGQEAGRRAGTENVLLISGMGKAAEVGHMEREDIYGSRYYRLGVLDLAHVQSQEEGYHLFRSTKNHGGEGKESTKFSTVGVFLYILVVVCFLVR